jgi:hypothetical protein
MLTDKFGVTWVVDVKALTPAHRAPAGCWAHVG